MSRIDSVYVAALNGAGFDPDLPDAVTPDNTIDVEGIDSSVSNMTTLLNNAAAYVSTNGSGGIHPFVFNGVGPAGPAKVSVDGSWSTDPMLIGLLTDTANYVNTAGTRTTGAPFQDAVTAFKRIALNDIIILAART
jgi:hypothetical protein